MSKFKFTKVPVKDMQVVENFYAPDIRGAFEKTFNTEEFEGYLPLEIRETILSFSKPGVIRGLHFQTPPQAKLVTCLKGCIWDVGVDLRPDSPTYLQWYGEMLSDENHKSLYIPRGFAHGYSAQKESIVLYQCDEVYCADGDSGIRYDDPDIGVDWHLALPHIVSNKDLSLQSFSEFILKNERI